MCVLPCGVGVLLGAYYENEFVVRGAVSQTKLQIFAAGTRSHVALCLCSGSSGCVRCAGLFFVRLNQLLASSAAHFALVWSSRALWAPPTIDSACARDFCQQAQQRCGAWRAQQCLNTAANAGNIRRRSLLKFCSSTRRVCSVCGRQLIARRSWYGA